jgi:hypothetical protein
MLGAVTSVTLNDVRMCIEMDVAAVACSLGIESDLFEPFDTTFDAPFTLKRRGVEIRFAMDAPSAKQDEALIANVARAYAWLEQIKAGTTIVEIADAEGTARRRVQQVLEFAFLAPDITRDILAGTQPIGLTSTWIMTHRLPLSWDEQRALIATL